MNNCALLPRKKKYVKMFFFNQGYDYSEAASWQNMYENDISYILDTFIKHFACLYQIKRVSGEYLSATSGKLNLCKTLNSLCKPAI